MNNQVTKKNDIQNNHNTIRDMLDKLKPQMAMAMPSHMTPDRMVRIALTELRKNPKLCECDPLSFVASVMLCGQLGLEIGVLGEAYLVPYKSQCTFILGYKGMIALARRSGEIISLTAHCVYENDAFKYSYGLNEVLEHTPALTNRGDLIGVYAVAKLKGGGYQFDVLSKEHIDLIKGRSKASSFGPWITDYDEMARKTAIRRLFKYLPASVEMQKAVAFEEQLELVGTDTKSVLAESDGIDLNFLNEEISESEAVISISQADAIAGSL